jgi:preprotein translocase subunit SecE
MQFIDYLRDTKSEWKHISWPSRRQAIGFTALVVALSITTALYLGAFDVFLAFLVKKLVA